MINSLRDGLASSESLRESKPLMALVCRVLFTAAIGILLLPSFAAGCDVPFVPSPTLFQQAEAVFIGRVVESPWEERRGARVATGKNQFVFEVQKTFKGSVPRLVTMTRMTDCTYPFLQNQTYLVHAELFEGRLETGQTLRPLPTKEAEEELKYAQGASIGKPPAVLIPAVVKAPFPGSVMLVLQGQSGRFEKLADSSMREIMLPAGEYTAWLEVAGKVVSDRKSLQLRESQITQSAFTFRQ